MTNRNLVGITLAVALATTALVFPTSAYAKSNETEIAKMGIPPETAAAVNNSIVDREWAIQRPSRGGVGYYDDSNVPAVWAGVPDRVRSIWRCIRFHESRHSGHYTAENPVSTASGAGQWLNGTWDGLKKWVKVDGEFVARQYDEAKDAPAWVQDAAFVHVYNHGGLRMWRGTWCPGT